MPEYERRRTSSRDRKRSRRSYSRDKGRHDHKGNGTSSSGRDRRRESSRKRSRSPVRRPRNIKELREMRLKERERRAERAEDLKEKAKLFDVAPDPNVISKAKDLANGLGPAFGPHGFNPKAVIAPKFAKSIYVGGIDPAHADEKELFAFFNEVLNKVTGQKLNPVQSMYINKIKGFGFLEVNDYNLATAIVQKLNGLEYYGSALSLRRPTNYDPLKAPPPGKLPILELSKIGLKSGRPSSYVENSPEKIYIAGIPYNVSDDQLQELLESFGPLESLCVIKEKGYAFCLYKDKNITDIACEGLNQMQLGASVLTVKRADQNLQQVRVESSVDPNKAILENKGPLGAFGTDVYSTQGLSNGPDSSYLLTGNTQKATSNNLILNRDREAEKPTKVISLKNMVAKEELMDDNEYKDILEDTTQECSKYGTVVEVQIPRNEKGLLENDALGTVYIKFEQELDAVQAKSALEGRTFGSQRLVTAFVASGELPLPKKEP